MNTKAIIIMSALCYVVIERYCGVMDTFMFSYWHVLFLIMGVGLISRGIILSILKIHIVICLSICLWRALVFSLVPIDGVFNMLFYRVIYAELLFQLRSALESSFLYVCSIIIRGMYDVVHYVMFKRNIIR